MRQSPSHNDQQNAIDCNGVHPKGNDRVSCCTTRPLAPSTPVISHIPMIHVRKHPKHPSHQAAQPLAPTTGQTAPSAAELTSGCCMTLPLWWPILALVTGHSASSPLPSVDGWSGGRMVVAGPMTGQTWSSSSFAWGCSMAFFRAGHFCASADEVVSF